MLFIEQWLRLWWRDRRCAPVLPRYVIRRSSLGRLTIRFTGGPVYPDMLDDLRDVYKRFGYLVRKGEELSGQGWGERIAATGACLSVNELQAIKTLLPNPAEPTHAGIAAMSSKGM